MITTFQTNKKSYSNNFDAKSADNQSQDDSFHFLTPKRLQNMSDTKEILTGFLYNSETGNICDEPINATPQLVQQQWLIHF